MPPKKKEADSKKTVQKKKTQLIDEKTFGLKNKNKSKKVQQQIKSIEKNVLNSGDPKMRKQEEERKQARVLAKAQKKALEEERNALFGEALLAVQKKSKTNLQEGKLEAKGRDAADDAADAKKGTSRAMKMMYQMDAQEMADRLREDPNYIPTLEDEIEQLRQQKVAELKASKTLGTPVTAETFAAWHQQKRLRKLEASRLLVEAELKKKKGGKGLGVLSGRSLYEYKRELFQDDDDDDNNNNNGEEHRGQVMDLSQMARQESVMEKENGDNHDDYQSSNDPTVNATTSLEESTATTTTATTTATDGGYSTSTNTTEANGGAAAAAAAAAAAVEPVTQKMQSHLFLQGDDDELDDLLE